MKAFAAIGSSIGAMLLLVFVWVLVPRNAEDFWPAGWMGAWTLTFFRSSDDFALGGDGGAGVGDGYL
jgi:hypothetical protein